MIQVTEEVLRDMVEAIVREVDPEQIYLFPYPSRYPYLEGHACPSPAYRTHRRAVVPEYKHWRNVPGPEDLCFVTTGIEGSVPLLAEPHDANSVLSALCFYREKYGFLIHAYVVMPEHVHLLLQLRAAAALQKLLADLKRYTAKQMLQWCRDSRRDDLVSFFAARGAVDGEKHSVWERSFRSVPVFTARAALVKAEYIHANPVRRGLSDDAESWWFSSASAYAGGQGPLQVDLIEL